MHIYVVCVESCPGKRAQMSIMLVQCCHGKKAQLCIMVKGLTGLSWKVGSVLSWENGWVVYHGKMDLLYVMGKGSVVCHGKRAVVCHGKRAHCCHRKRAHLSVMGRGPSDLSVQIFILNMLILKLSCDMLYSSFIMRLQNICTSSKITSFVQN